MSRQPNVCVLKADGINCDEETSFAFEESGANSEVVHMTQLRSGEKSLSNFQILAIPGGFSYGDDIRAGAVLANEFKTTLGEDVQRYVELGRPIVGICNGFQVLVQSGLLPSGELSNNQATLAKNEIGHFVWRWIDMEVGVSACKYIKPSDIEDGTFPAQTAHAEGRIVTPELGVDIPSDQIVFKYAMPPHLQAGEEGDGLEYPHNPSGSKANVAGICDPSGTILGMMPHPERSFGSMHPHRLRTESARTAASILFSNIVNYAKEM